MAMVCIGIQHREVAVIRSRKEKDQAGVWAKGEASGNPKKDVLCLS